MFNHALIMAAGEGSRMRPLTDYVPKAMIKIGGQELIKYSIDLIQSNHKNIDIHVTAGFKSEILVPFLLQNQYTKSIFNTKNQNNGWWLFNSVLKHVNEPIIVLTCDNIMSLNLKKVYDDYINLGSPTCMIVPINWVETKMDAEGDYLLIDEENNVNYIGRNKKGMRMASGCQIINPSKLNRYVIDSDFSFNNIWEQLKHYNELKCSNITPTIWNSFDNVTQICNLKNNVNL